MDSIVDQRRYTIRILMCSFLFISHGVCSMYVVTPRAYVISRSSLRRQGLALRLKAYGNAREKEGKREGSANFRRKIKRLDVKEEREVGVSSVCFGAYRRRKFYSASSFSPPEICLMRKTNRAKVYGCLCLAQRAATSSPDHF